MKKLTVILPLMLMLFPFGLTAQEPGGELTIALSSNEMTLDPLHSYRTDELQVATGIYEGLVSYNPENLRPIPGVAYKWYVSEY